MTKLALDDRAVIGVDELEQLYQAAIFYAEQVVVRASAAIARGPAHEHIKSKLGQLRDMGLLSTWAHEYELDRRERLATSVSRWGPNEPELTLTAAQVRTLVDEVDETLRLEPDAAYALSAEEPRRQGILEIARLRHRLCVAKVIDELELDGLLSHMRWAATLREDARPGHERRTFQRDVIREVVGRCQFGPLSELPPEAIERCRDHAPAFQELVARTAGERVLRDEADPGAVADEIAERYRLLLEEYGRPQLPAEIGGEVGWDVLAYALPPSIAAKYGVKLLRWRRKNREFGPFLLLSDVHRGLPRK